MLILEDKMRKAIIRMAMIAIVLMSLAACQPRYIIYPIPGTDTDVSTGPSAQEIAENIDPLTLVNEVLTKATADQVEIDNSLAGPDTTMRAIGNGSYTFTATVTFKAYPTAAGTITGGVLVYTIPGTVESNKFSAYGNGTVTTSEPLIINNVATMEINDNSAVISLTANVTDEKNISIETISVRMPSAQISVNDSPVVIETNPITVRDTNEVNAELQEFMKNFIKVNNAFNSGDKPTSGQIAEKMGIDESLVFVDLGYFGEVDNIELSGHEYAAESPIISISIGNNAFYEDTAYKIDTATGNLLVNKAAFIFSLLAKKGISVNGTLYDGYSLFNGTPTTLTISNVKVGGTATSTDNPYDIELTVKNTMTTYDYNTATEGDIIYVITRDPETNEVTQNSLLKSSAPSYGSYVYFTPWNQEITEHKEWSVTKAGTVFTSEGVLKGSYNVTFNVTTNPTGSTETGN